MATMVKKSLMISRISRFDSLLLCAQTLIWHVMTVKLYVWFTTHRIALG